MSWHVLENLVRYAYWNGVFTEKEYCSIADCIREEDLRGLQTFQEGFEPQKLTREASKYYYSFSKELSSLE